MFFEIIAATIAVSLISLVGIIFIGLRKEFLQNFVFVLVSFAVGAMLGSAFLHIIPEALEEANNPQFVFLLVLIGFIIFFCIEKFLHWRHCHEDGCEIHPVAYMNLIGDAAHNFMDGAIIAVSFMTDINTGIAVTIAIILHEIPQEIGDFGVLIRAGLSRSKALFYNLLSALIAVIGAILTYFFISTFHSIEIFLLPLTAGCFIYMASVDLIPGLHRERSITASVLQFLMIVSGIILMYNL